MFFFKKRILDFFISDQIAIGPSKEIPEGFEMILMQADDFDSCAMIVQENRKDKFIDRLTKGHICYGLRMVSSNKIIGYFWFSLPKSEVPIVFGVISRDIGPYGYIWDCRIDPAFRGQGFYTQGLKFLRSQYSQFLLWMNCEPDNLASLKAIERAGFLKKARYVFYKFGSFGAYRHEEDLMPKFRDFIFADIKI